jgi:hypothetical protein
MTPDGIVETINVTADRLLGPRGAGPLNSRVDDSVVEVVPRSKYRDPDAMFLKFRLIGCRVMSAPTIRVVDRVLSRSPDCQG